MTYKRNIYNLDAFKGLIDSLIDCANSTVKGYDLEESHYFKKESRNHPLSIIPNIHDGSFEAIPNRFIRKTPPLLEKFKELEKSLNIEDLILTRYITRFQPNDFLEWRKHNKAIGKFLLISTTKCHVAFKDEIIILSPYRAIAFNPMDEYCIKNVKDMENWIVFIIPEIQEPLEDYEVHF